MGWLDNARFSLQNFTPLQTIQDREQGLIQAMVESLVSPG